MRDKYYLVFLLSRLSSISMSISKHAREKNTIKEKNNRNN